MSSRATVTAPEGAAAEAAAAIHRGFHHYRSRFHAVTAGAQARFEQADWAAVQAANSQRLALYDTEVADVSDALADKLGGATLAGLDWAACKDAYRELISGEYVAELSESFYNSVHRHMTDDAAVDDAAMFVSTCFPEPPALAPPGLTKTYLPSDGIVELMREIARDLPFANSWRNLERDLGNVLRSLAEERPEITATEGLSVEMLQPIFYRNKGAYIVGRLRFGDASWPIAFAVLLDQRQRLYIDTLICDEDELSVLFSFTRAYFMVQTQHAHALVQFLAKLLPNKKLSELYASIGLHKHAKTVFYRDFLEHLETSDDAFVIAAGIKGMVMTVFTLPSYQIVFKIIKDRFAPQKNITAEQVREKYQIVKLHDRVGRMADTQEFKNLTLPKARFDPALLEELTAMAPSAVEIDDDTVRIRHVYTERLMTPLNLYLQEATEHAVTEALEEYGNAIKQLAAANIFPGDMLLKNFGVTRHGRVVFYDYDEISYLTDVNFREIPEPRTPEEEMASDPWYTVGPDDVFPEEFRRFLFGKRSIKQLFTRMHGELFEADYWRALQDEIRDGQVMDVFPYRRKKRFIRQLRAQGRSTP